jgi:uracil-DNA glycosylase family 4
MSDEAALEELRFLTRALRAHAEWQATTGATGLARASSVSASVNPGALAEPRALERAPESAHAPEAARSPEPASALDGTRTVVPRRAHEGQGDWQKRLQMLEEAVRPCTRCGLAKHRKQTVFARGTGSSGVCFVGEGPGADEDAQGLPFVGKAGQLLDKMIEAMGLDRDEVYVCNVVKCRPPDNRKPELDEMAACMPYLNQQLELVAPQVIVALGATAVQGLFGTTEGITRMRGKWKSLREIPVMPTFHPAYLLRTPAAKREVWEDLQEVLRKIGRSPPTRR